MRRLVVTWSDFPASNTSGYQTDFDWSNEKFLSGVTRGARFTVHWGKCLGTGRSRHSSSLSCCRYFNYRTTRFLAEEGFYKFHNWFDDRAWYPLGRIIGGTIYPGEGNRIFLFLTAVAYLYDMEQCVLFLISLFCDPCNSILITDS